MAAFNMIFPSEDDNDDDGEETVKVNKQLSFKRDVSDALIDIGELGFLVGYFGAQTFFAELVYKPLIEYGISYERSNANYLSNATLAFLMVWVLCTKMRDYARAVNRAKNAKHFLHSECASPLLAHAQIV